MKIGDTFVWCPPGTVKDHLWILISDPTRHAGKCVLVNLTKSANAPHSFVLKPGQHPWIYKNSDVNFGDAYETSEERLNKCLELGFAIAHQPMAPGIVSAIIKTAHTHCAFQRRLRKFLPPP